VYSAFHLACYQKVQIIGYCLGSLSATEVARRLQEKGVEIVDMILIDGYRVPFIIEDDLIVEMTYLPNMFVSTEQVGFGSFNNDLFMTWFMETLQANDAKIPKDAGINIGGTPELDELGNVFRKMAEYSEEERFKAYVDAMPATDGQKLPYEMVIRMYKTCCQSFRAAHFASPPYFGDYRYLQAEDGSTFLPGMSEQTVEFWKGVCLGDFTIDVIKGNHYTCIEPPFVDNVAAHVGAPLFEMKKSNF
jgi:pyochelin synthetase